ncbi:MAG: FG-GAP-like repeat-containing protein [Thermoplasmata archaeon]
MDYDYFGYTLCSGDVNGDAYIDVLVGGFGYSNSKGKVYLYLGSAGGLSTTDSWTKNGENNYDYFGCDINGCDVNGDGYDDLIVGAYGYSNSKGKVYLYLGSASGLSATESWTKTGENENDWFAYDLSTGDINGDGYSDVIISSYRYSDGRGKVYVYVGSASGLSIGVVWTKEGEGTNNYFGYGVGCAGDVNSDGCDDLLIGAYGYSSSRGKVYLYLGSLNGLWEEFVWSAVGENDADSFGQCVASAGDVNDDGLDDIIIATPIYTSSQYLGKAYLYT